MGCLRVVLSLTIFKQFLENNIIVTCLRVVLSLTIFKHNHWMLINDLSFESSAIFNYFQTNFINCIVKTFV